MGDKRWAILGALKTLSGAAHNRVRPEGRVKADAAGAQWRARTSPPEAKGGGGVIHVTEQQPDPQNVAPRACVVVRCACHATGPVRWRCRWTARWCWASP